MELKMTQIKSLIPGRDLRPDGDDGSYAELKTSVAAKGVLFPLVAVKTHDPYTHIYAINFY